MSKRSRASNKKKVVKHRIFWHQIAGDKVLVRWHTGTKEECDVLAQTCKACHEVFWILEVEGT